VTLALSSDDLTADQVCEKARTETGCNNGVNCTHDRKYMNMHEYIQQLQCYL